MALWIVFGFTVLFGIRPSKVALTALMVAATNSDNTNSSGERVGLGIPVFRESGGIWASPMCLKIGADMALLK